MSSVLAGGFLTIRPPREALELHFKIWGNTAFQSFIQETFTVFQVLYSSRHRRITCLASTAVSYSGERTQRKHMENGGQNMVKGRQISAEVWKALGEECMKSFPGGKKSEGRGRVGMRNREEQGWWKWRQPRSFARAPSGDSLLATWDGLPGCLVHKSSISLPLPETILGKQTQSLPRTNASAQGILRERDLSFQLHLAQLSPV